MTGTTSQRTLIRVQQVLLGVLAIGLLWGTTRAFADNAENTLLVWAGDKAHEAPDFLTVIDLRMAPTETCAAPAGSNWQLLALR